MASIGHLETLKARALQQAIARVEGLIGQESEPLMRARADAVARSMPGFDAAVLAAELSRVVSRQAERIADLERRVESLSPEPAARAESSDAAEPEPEPASAKK